MHLSIENSGTEAVGSSSLTTHLLHQSGWVRLDATDGGKVLVLVVGDVSDLTPFGRGPDGFWLGRGGGASFFFAGQAGHVVDAFGFFLRIGFGHDVATVTLVNANINPVGVRECHQFDVVGVGTRLGNGSNVTGVGEITIFGGRAVEIDGRALARAG